MTTDPEHLEGLLRQLANKADIADLRGTTRAAVSDLRGQTKTDIAEVRSELKADIIGLRGDVKADIADLRGELRGMRWGISIVGTILAGLTVLLRFI